MLTLAMLVEEDAHGSVVAGTAIGANANADASSSAGSINARITLKHTAVTEDLNPEVCLPIMIMRLIKSVKNW